MSRLARYTAVIAATLTVLLLLWQFREVILLFLFSLFVASAVRPLINRLIQFGLSLAQGMVVVYLSGLLLAVLSGYLLGPTLVAELQEIGDKTALAYEVTHPSWVEGEMWQQAIAGRLPNAPQLINLLTSESEAAARLLFGIGQSLLTLVAGVVIVLVLSIYWSIDQTRFERLWLSLLPADRRTWARNLWRTIEEGVGAYMRSELIQAVLAFLLLALGYGLLGLSYPLTLSLVGGLAWLIPLIGALFVVIPVLLVGMSSGWLVGITAVLYTLVVLLALERVIEPRIFRQRRYSPMLVILTLFIMVQVLGIVGLILAPTIAAALQILFSALLALREQRGQSPVQLAELKERLEQIQANYNQQEQPIPPEIESMIDRLQRLLQQAQEPPAIE
ncbi:MAG: AI-2E family transporter [Chloroflexota bacterium]